MEARCSSSFCLWKLYWLKNRYSSTNSTGRPGSTAGCDRNNWCGNTIVTFMRAIPSFLFCSSGTGHYNTLLPPILFPIFCAMWMVARIRCIAFPGEVVFSSWGVSSETFRLERAKKGIILFPFGSLLSAIYCQIRYRKMKETLIAHSSLKSPG